MGGNNSIHKTYHNCITNNKISEGEIKETIPFDIASKRIKYLGINLPKETKDLYSEKYKILIEETYDRKRWKDTHTYIYIYVLRLEKSMLSKWLYHPRQSTNSMQSLSNYEWHFSQH